jgi:tRNA (uracil-5-)-methyltransferase TRM9
MQPETIDKLLEINHQFYQTFAEEFSATRQRLQPGVVQVLDAIPLTASILDLGCGNGQLAAYLTERGHIGNFLGIDAAQNLVDIARQLGLPKAKFLQADLTSSSWDTQLGREQYEYIFCFAMMHHIPSQQLREDFLHKVRRLLAPGGRFTFSNWQFLDNPRLSQRIVPWETVGVEPEAVDQHDYLLDWRRGGTGYRYVHYFTNTELNSLAEATGFKVSGLFTSDGEGNNLGLYHIWEQASAA